MADTINQQVSLEALYYCFYGPLMDLYRHLFTSIKLKTLFTIRHPPFPFMPWIKPHNPSVVPLNKDLNWPKSCHVLVSGTTHLFTPNVGCCGLKRWKDGTEQLIMYYIYLKPLNILDLWWTLQLWSCPDLNTPLVLLRHFYSPKDP